MMDYIKPFLTYEGTMTRKPYILGTVLMLIFVISILPNLLYWLGFRFFAGMLGPTGPALLFFATAQRLRDIGWSPLWALLMTIPIANVILAAVLNFGALYYIFPMSIIMLIFYIALCFIPSKEVESAE